MIFFDYGAKIRLKAIFADSAGTVIDPTTVSFKYLADAVGITTTLTYPNANLIRELTGNYYTDIDTNEASGRYTWNWIATGTGQASSANEFYVRATLNTPTITATASSTITFVDNDIPAETPDGTITLFTLSYIPITGTVQLFLNGIYLILGIDYTISGKTITFTDPPLLGDRIRAWYRR